MERQLLKDIWCIYTLRFWVTLSASSTRRLERNWPELAKVYHLILHWSYRFSTTKHQKTCEVGQSWLEINWWFSLLPSLKLTASLPLKIGHTNRTFHLPTINIQKIWYILSGRIIFELLVLKTIPRLIVFREFWVLKDIPTVSFLVHHQPETMSTIIGSTNLPPSKKRTCQWKKHEDVYFFLLMRFLGHCHSLVFGTFETPWKVHNRLDKILPKSPGLKHPGKRTQQSLRK